MGIDDCDYFYTMDQDLLKDAYSAETFRQEGHRYIDMLADHLEHTISAKPDQVINWQIPEDEHRFWRHYMQEGNASDMAALILERCIHIHHPRYMGHQISPVIPFTGLTSLLGAVLNNGMGIYEMGAAPTAMERVVTDSLCQALGLGPASSGFLTSGGTLANLTALLSARRRFLQNRPEHLGPPGQLAILVSEEAHYCIERAVQIMGLGQRGMISIPVNDQYRMRSELLEDYINDARNSGIEVFALVGSAPSTATGIYDNLSELAQFSTKHGIWFHVDAAHGGAAIFSGKYKHLLDGVQQADSVVIDGHKMMMIPAITTALLFADGKNGHLTFRQKAEYLLEESVEEDWYNLAKRTFECTKHMMSLHWYGLLKYYGVELFDQFVTRLYDMTAKFAALLEEAQDFELAVLPMSNILCFRYTGNSKKGFDIDTLNKAIRQRLLEDGSYYIVQTRLITGHYLRTTIMNPFTTEEHFRGLMDEIRKIAKNE